MGIISGDILLPKKPLKPVTQHVKFCFEKFQEHMFLPIFVKGRLHDTSFIDRTAHTQKTDPDLPLVILYRSLNAFNV